MSDEVAILRTMYERFNARDIDGVLVAVDDNVEWANGMDGGHVHGKDGVRDYWTRQWAQVSPRVDPLSFDRRADGRIAVKVQLELFDLSGQPLASQGGLQSHVLHHVYTFAGRLVTRFDIEEG